MSYRPRRVEARLGGTIDTADMIRRGYFSLLALTILLWPAAVTAQDDPGARALDLFDRAEVAYHEGYIDDAIALLLEAQTLAPDEPVLTYNLARAYEAAGRDEDALASYEAYLAAEPGTPDRGAISRRIDALRNAIAERERLEAERLAQIEREREREASTRDAPWPWVVMGVGAAGLATGVVFGVLSLVDRQAAIDDPVHASAFASLRRAETDALVANVLFGIGGAVALGGLIWGIVQVTSGGHAAETVALLPDGSLRFVLE